MPERGGLDVVVVGGGAAGCVVAARLAESGTKSVLLLEAGPDRRADLPGELRDGWTIERDLFDWGYTSDDGAAVRRKRIVGGTGWLTRFTPRGGPPTSTNGCRWGTSAGGSTMSCRISSASRPTSTSGAAVARGSRADPVVAVPRPRIRRDHGGEPRCAGRSRRSLGRRPQRAWSGRRRTHADELDRRRPRHYGRRISAARFDALEPDDSRRRGGSGGDVRRHSRERRASRGRHGDRGRKRGALRRHLWVSGDPDALRHRSCGAPSVGGRAGHPRPPRCRREPRRPSGARHRLRVLRNSWGGPVLHAIATFHSSDRPTDEPPDLMFWLCDPEGEPPAAAIGVVLLKPLSRGSVRLRSADATDAPRIQLPTLDGRSDVERLAEGYLRALELANRPELRALCTGAAPTALRNDDELHERIRAEAFSVPHVVGTCAMGPRPDDGAVVDASVRVHGVDGIYVVDASIMPTVPSGFTHVPTIMIAERLAEQIA